MKSLVIFDSVFGNTELVARAVGSALGADVLVLNVRQVSLSDLNTLELLVVGAPTRQFSATPELLAFLDSLPAESLRGVKAAAFDTRIELKDIPFFFRGIVNKGGYAAPLIAKKLELKGASLVAVPMGFFVKDREGPMKDGELKRAGEWGKEILPA